MTVDSEAIFAVAAHSGGAPRALERLRGAMAAAWLDEGRADVVHVARGTGRPLWLGSTAGAVLFASTRLALEVAERYLRLELRKRELGDGTALVLRDGAIALEERFRADASYVEENPLPPVRAPREGQFCLTRLAQLAAA
jgi:hypothetical protein